MIFVPLQNFLKFFLLTNQEKIRFLTQPKTAFSVMAKTFEKVWINCLEIIKDIVEWQHYKTWFEPIRPVEIKNNVLVIQVPSQFFYEYLEEHYVNLLAKTLRRVLGKEAR